MLNSGGHKIRNPDPIRMALGMVLVFATLHMCIKS
jgi:hypothetical protein